MLSKPRVFIIESLEFDDEIENKYEGTFLSQILHLGMKKSEYYYFRTKKELRKILRIFRDSEFRYLHLSCHGDDNSFATTLESIKFNEFGKIVRPFLEDRRLFISACESANENLAKAVIPTSGCRSIVGPSTTLHFDEAAIIWASFYHLIFKADEKKITRKTIGPTLRKVVNAFGITMNHFWRTDDWSYRHATVTPKVDVSDLDDED